MSGDKAKMCLESLTHLNGMDVQYIQYMDPYFSFCLRDPDPDSFDHMFLNSSKNG